MPQRNLTGSASDHYLQRLDLGADPFDPHFQTDVFYPGGDRRRMLDQLIHYARFSQQPLLLSSEQGSGKSSVLRELMEQLQPVMECCRISVDVLNDREAILEALAERLALKLDAEQSLDSFIDALHFTLAAGEEPEPILIVVEKVQLLTLDELEFLLEIHRRSRGGVHLLLVSDQLNAVLEVMVGEGAEGLKCLELRPLSTDETAEYLMSCLQAVGFAGDMPLSVEQLAELHRESKGNFGRIRELAPSFLHSRNSLDTVKSRFAIPLTHVVAIAILAAALVVAYLYKGESAHVNAPVMLAVGTSDNAVVSSPLKSDRSLIDGVSNTTVATLDDPELTAESAVNEPLEELADAEEPALDGEALGRSVNVNHADELNESPVVDVPIIHEPKLPIKEQAISQSRSEQRFNAREQRLLDLSETSYMLQLLGSRSEQSAKAFMKSYTGRMPMTYFETELKARPWYVVLAGPYTNREKALAAIRHLPQKLQKQKPWARSVEGVQRDIRKKKH